MQVAIKTCGRASSGRSNKSWSVVSKLVNSSRFELMPRGAFTTSGHLRSTQTRRRLRPASQPSLALRVPASQGSPHPHRKAGTPSLHPGCRFARGKSDAPAPATCTRTRRRGQANSRHMVLENFPSIHREFKRNADKQHHVHNGVCPGKYCAQRFKSLAQVLGELRLSVPDSLVTGSTRLSSIHHE